MDNKQIDGKILLLYFNNSNTAEATITIPCLVTDILFRPPSSSLNPAVQTTFIVTSTLVNGGCQTLSGYNAITHSSDFRHRFQKPETIRGTYSFSVFDIQDGSPAVISGGLSFPIEFIGYNKH